LWIVALAAYLGYDALVAHGHAERGLGAATVVLYLASSLGIQRVIVQSRAHRLQAGRAAPVAQLRGFSWAPAGAAQPSQDACAQPSVPLGRGLSQWVRTAAAP
jgi:hypothetical protein